MTIDPQMDFAPPKIPKEIRASAKGKPGTKWTNEENGRTYELSQSGRWIRSGDKSKSSAKSTATKTKKPKATKSKDKGAAKQTSVGEEYAQKYFSGKNEKEKAELEKIFNKHSSDRLNDRYAKAIKTKDPKQLSRLIDTASQMNPEFEKELSNKMGKSQKNPLTVSPLPDYGPQTQKTKKSPGKWGKKQEEAKPQTSSKPKKQPRELGFNKLRKKSQENKPEAPTISPEELIEGDYNSPEEVLDAVKPPESTPKKRSLKEIMAERAKAEEIPLAKDEPDEVDSEEQPKKKSRSVKKSQKTSVNEPLWGKDSPKEWESVYKDATTGEELSDEAYDSIEDRFLSLDPPDQDKMKNELRREAVKNPDSKTSRLYNKLTGQDANWSIDSEDDKDVTSAAAFLNKYGRGSGGKDRLERAYQSLTPKQQQKVLKAVESNQEVNPKYLDFLKERTKNERSSPEVPEGWTSESAIKPGSEKKTKGGRFNRIAENLEKIGEEEDEIFKKGLGIVGGLAEPYKRSLERAGVDTSKVESSTTELPEVPESNVGKKKPGKSRFQSLIDDVEDIGQRETKNQAGTLGVAAKMADTIRKLNPELGSSANTEDKSGLGSTTADQKSLPEGWSPAEETEETVDNESDPKEENSPEVPEGWSIKPKKKPDAPEDLGLDQAKEEYQMLRESRPTPGSEDYKRMIALRKIIKK